MSGYSDKEKKSSKLVWQKIYKQGVDADGWGQSVEAAEEYEKLSKLLEQQIPELSLTISERSTLMKVRHILNLRIAALSDLTSASSSSSSSVSVSSNLKSSDMKKLESVFEELFVNDQIDFPIELNDFSVADKKTDKKEQQIRTAENEAQDGGTLLPPPKVKAGQTTISLDIDKIGLKDAQTYIHPHLNVVVADTSGRIFEEQSTPYSRSLKPTYVNFSQPIHIQTSLEELKTTNSAVFFEFRHYKPKKKKTSTRCFALLEPAELEKRAAQNGDPVCLELYKKPTDFKRKSLNLFTAKPLYLHLTVTFNKH